MSRRNQPDLLLRGVLYTLRRKCGKPTCHCTTGDLHEGSSQDKPERCYRASQAPTRSLAAPGRS